MAKREEIQRLIDKVSYAQDAMLDGMEAVLHERDANMSKWTCYDNYGLWYRLVREVEDLKKKADSFLDLTQSEFPLED